MSFLSTVAGNSLSLSLCSCCSEAERRNMRTICEAISVGGIRDSNSARSEAPPRSSLAGSGQDLEKLVTGWVIICKRVAPHSHCSLSLRQWRRKEISFSKMRHCITNNAIQNTHSNYCCPSMPSSIILVGTTILPFKGVWSDIQVLYKDVSF